MAWRLRIFCDLGGLNGLYQVAGEILQPFKSKLVKMLHIDKESIGHKFICTFITFILVDFTWIFFRADSTGASFYTIKMMAVNNPWVLFDGSIYKCGLDQKNYWLMICGILLLLIVDFLKSRKIVIRKIVAKQHVALRWLIIDMAIIVLLILGIWGSTYDAVNFIYFQF